MSKRRKYSPEFKQGAVEQVRQPGGSCTPVEGITVVASRSHGNVTELESFLSNFKVAEFRNAGSSLKICLIASGEADLYPRFGRTMDWILPPGTQCSERQEGALQTHN